MKRCLQLDASRRPPQHNNVHKHTHAQKSLKLLQASIASSIKSVNDIKASNDRETLALLYQANIFSNDMQRVVYNLQKIVIQTFEDGTFDPELDSAVKQFSQFAYSIQQYFSDDPEMLKNQIKVNLRDIMPQARRLVESVQGNKNQEYIHETVAVVDDLLFSVQKIEFRNKFENETPDSIVLPIIKYRDNLRNLCNSFNHVNLSVLRDMKHAVRVAMWGGIRMVKVLDDKAENYDEDIKNVLLQVSFSLIRDLGDIDAYIRSKHDIKSIKDAFSMIGSSVALDLENLLELLKIKIEDEQVANNLHNLIMLVVVNKIAAAELAARNIEFARIQTSDD